MRYTLRKRDSKGALSGSGLVSLAAAPPAADVVVQTAASLGAAHPGPQAIVGCARGWDLTATIYWVSCRSPSIRTGKDRVVTSAKGLDDASKSWT